MWDYSQFLIMIRYSVKINESRSGQLVSILLTTRHIQRDALMHNEEKNYWDLVNINQGINRWNFVEFELAQCTRNRGLLTEHGYRLPVKTAISFLFQCFVFSHRPLLYTYIKKAYSLEGVDTRITDFSKMRSLPKVLKRTYHLFEQVIDLNNIIKCPNKS
jgi:hypothetical protein